MKTIKDTIDVSGTTITKIGNMTWKQVLTFFVVSLIVIASIAIGSSYIFANRAATDAVELQLELQQ